jgi:hypothetical protein
MTNGREYGEKCIRYNFNTLHDGIAKCLKQLGGAWAELENCSGRGVSVVPSYRERYYKRQLDDSTGG